MTSSDCMPAPIERNTSDGLAFFVDTAPAIETLRDAALAGLGAAPKRLSPKFLYDEIGSALFEDITRLPEYYLTRTEIGILNASAPEIADTIGRRAVILELGAGASEKVRILLDAFHAPSALAAVDISGDHLRAALAPLAKDYPDLAVGGIAADFTRSLSLPADLFTDAGRRVVFLPGSTIGNFPPEIAGQILASARGLVRPGDALLIGVDLVKDAGVLVPAYADAAGVTAEFIKNALARLNRDLGADFNLDAFAYDARWNPKESRIEMRLISAQDQTARIEDHHLSFGCGEVIEVSFSRKYTPDGFTAIAEPHGWTRVETWTDADAAFAVLLFEAA